MMMKKSDLKMFYTQLAVSALVWLFVGASMPLLVMGQNAAAIVMLLVALVLWPFRLKFTLRRIHADSFEEAMRGMLKHEREGK